MKKIKTIIIDDEYLARQLLEGYTEKVPFLELVAKCENAFEATDILQREEIDLIFLDINMPDLDGISFLKSLKNRPEVILTTAYSEYAVEGYQLDVLEYLLKPIYMDRFIQAVHKAKEMITLKELAACSQKEEIPPSSLPCLSSPIALPPREDYIFVKTGSQKIARINFRDILFVESLHEYIRIHLTNENHVIYYSLKNILERLPKHQFMQIHRSYIINFDQISMIKGSFVEINQTEIKIGKNFRQDLFRRIKRQSIGIQSPEKRNKESIA